MVSVALFIFNYKLFNSFSVKKFGTSIRLFDLGSWEIFSRKMFQGQKLMRYYKCFPSLSSTLKGLGSVLSITSDSFHKHILEDGGWAGFVGKCCFPFVKVYSKLLFEYVYWSLSS